MDTYRRALAVVVAGVLLASCGAEGQITMPEPFVVPTPAPSTDTPETDAATGTPSTEPVDDPTPIPGLVVAAEGPRTGYSREQFGRSDWIDADRDGCDTRKEVLIEESFVAVTLGPRCKVLTGSWFSIYDGLSYTTPANLEIDHFVPLGEAWDSGAKKWTATKREQYANFLDDPGHLIAVTGSENGSKGDRDPAEWMPDREDIWCTYAQTWIAIKVRWKLTADADEADALRSVLDSC